MAYGIAKIPPRGVFLWTAIFLLALSSRLLAASPTQQDVFKSIQESMGAGKEVDSTPVYVLAAGGALALIVLTVLSRRQARDDSIEAFNHPGKLMKEVLQDVPLKAAEVKQLKLLAKAVEAQTGEDMSPLTLLLCPSLMAKGLKEDRGKVDRKTLAQMVRRLRMSGTHGKP